MTPSRRIAVNITATYSRSLIAAGLALFSSRWVLNALGQADYGLFSVVGSIIIFITFFNTVMASSATRYFAFSIGAGDSTEVNRWFNSALGIHLSLAFILIIIGLPIGNYIICNILTVPPDRVVACQWVFRISLASAFTSIVSVPFVAMFTAKQHMAELAAWGMLQSFLSFTLAWFLRHAFGDRLLFYSAGMVVILVFVQTAQIFRAMTIFEECGIVCRQWLDRNRLKEIFTYSSWNIIGSSGVLLRDQGSAILLNLFFGPGVNAAYGIATQVSIQTNQLSSALVGAFSPEIMASEGRGDRARMLLLAQRTSKFGTILVLFLAIPLITEMNYVLNLWLLTPPPYSALLCQLILITFLIDRLSTGYMLAVHAHGKIAGYQITIGTSLLLTLPLAWFFFKAGFSPTSIGLAFIITMTAASLGRVLWGRLLFGMQVRCWLISVVWPSTIVALFTTIAAVTLRFLMPPSFLRLVLVSVICFVISLFTARLLALDNIERDYFCKKLFKGDL